MRLFISLISFMLLTACAGTPMSVYLDAPANGTQVKKPVTIKVHEITTRALNKSLAYPMGVRKSLDGYKKVSTLNPKFSRRSVLEKYNFLKKLNKGDRAYVNFLEGFTKSNTTLDNEDISIFELKIIGISSGVETVVSKRFTGPVKRFNWVELFENKVPKDQSGYLLSGTAYINYIPIFERPSSDSSPAVIEKEHKQYLVPIPIIFSVEREYRDSLSGGVIYSEQRNLCLFGYYWNGPMAKVTYSKSHLMENGAHIFSSGSDFLQSIRINSGNSCNANNKVAEDIFKNKIIKIDGKPYPHAYLLNKNFVSINEMINTKLSRRRVERKKIKQAAMHLAYKDDSALHEINRTMSDARSALGELSLTCKRSAKSTKSLANAWSKLGISRSDKDRRYGGHAYHFGNIKKRIEYYQNGITKATVRFEKLVEQPDGIQASTRSLEEYSTEVSMIPQSLNSAKVFCTQLGSAVSALGGVSIRSTPSFMSMLGGVLQDSYRKSINSRSGYSSSSSSGPEPGTVESLNSMWSGFREANKKSMNAIRLSRLNQTKKNSEYLKSLQQVRNDYRRTGKIPASIQKSNSGAACIAKGGKYNKRSRNCTIYKEHNTVVLKKLPVNRVGFDNNPQSQSVSPTNNSGSSKGQSSACSSPSYTAPSFTAEGKNAAPYNSVGGKVNTYMRKTCGSDKPSYNANPSIQCEVIEKIKHKYISNLTRERCTSEPFTFSCSCARKAGSGMSM